MTYADGLLIDRLITQNTISHIENEELKLEDIKAIVLHQTAGASGKSAMNFWANTKTNSKKTGAHFVIDRGGGVYKGIDGQIFQTAHITKVCRHVGRIRSKCYITGACIAPAGEKPTGEEKASKAENWAQVYKLEKAKSYPDRFPMNQDSLGIEIVAVWDEKAGCFPAPTWSQMAAASYLIQGLAGILPQIKLPVAATPVIETLAKEMPELTPLAQAARSRGDIYQHGTIAHKKPDEGSRVITVYAETNALAASVYPFLLPPPAPPAPAK